MALPFAAFLPMIGQGIQSIGQGIFGGAANRRNIRFQQQANQQNIDFQRETNAANQAFNREMYNLQRQHNLEDYAMQNDYNSPTSQMQRLREAGLNPHLVYGNGATTTAAPVRGGTAPHGDAVAPKVHAPRVDNSMIADAFNMQPYFQMQNQVLQHDNLKVINEKLAAETNAIKTRNKTELITQLLKSQDLTAKERENLIADALISTRIDTEQEKNKGLHIANDIKQAKEERDIAKHAKNMEEAIERIALMKIRKSSLYIEQNLMRQQLENMKKDGVLKDWEIKLSQAGITKNDNIFTRIVGTMLSQDGLLQKIDQSSEMKWLKEKTGFGSGELSPEERTALKGDPYLSPMERWMKKERERKSQQEKNWWK